MISKLLLFGRTPGPPTQSDGQQPRRQQHCAAAAVAGPRGSRKGKVLLQPAASALLMPPPLQALALAALSTAAPPPECQPLAGDLRFIPQFHAVPELRPRSTDGLPWPGQANDANAVFEHDGVHHIMFQTKCTELDANSTDGICAGGKVSGHAFSHLVSTDGGVHWRRITDALIPTPGSTYDGHDGDCDGTVSFPEGIGPVILWGADCGTGKWPPPKPPSPPHRRQLTSDYPRVAVAMAVNVTDPLLRSWRKNGLVAWSDPTQPCSFPGRVWRSDPNVTGKPPHWSMVGTGAKEGPKPTTMGSWNRYETTDPTLHGPWVLADTSFATQANGHAIGSISTPGFYSLPTPRAGEPTHIINGGMGGAFYTAHFDHATEKLVNLSARSFHVGGSWGVAGQSDSDGSILHIGWSSAGGGHAGPGIAMMSLVTELSYDRASDSLVTNPASWYSKMHNATLTDQVTLTLGAGATDPTRVFTPKLACGANGAASDLTLRLQLPSDSSQAVALEVRVLAADSPTGNATSIMINITAAVGGGGGRKGVLSITSSYLVAAVESRHADAAQSSRAGGGNHGQAFEVLVGESTVDLRILTDRSIIEAFAMNGRAMELAHDYPADGDSKFHLLNWGVAPLIIHNLTISSMACGWVEE